jgi:hypothetical protein
MLSICLASVVNMLLINVLSACRLVTICWSTLSLEVVPLRVVGGGLSCVVGAPDLWVFSMEGGRCQAEAVLAVGLAAVLFLALVYVPRLMGHARTLCFTW